MGEHESGSPTAAPGTPHLLLCHLKGGNGAAYFHFVFLL